MSSIFTEYVRSLVPGGAPPDSERFAELWEAVRAVLVREIEKRGIPSRQPDYEELTAECYAFIFVRRLRSLRAQIRVRSDIDGLICLNVRHFLHSRERELAAGADAVGPGGHGLSSRRKLVEPLRVRLAGAWAALGRLVRSCPPADSDRVGTMRLGRRHRRGSGGGGDSR